MITIAVVVSYCIFARVLLAWAWGGGKAGDGRVSVTAPEMRDEQKRDTSNWPESGRAGKHRSGHS